MLKKIYIYFIQSVFFLSVHNYFLSLPSLLFSPSLLFTLYGPKRNLCSLFLLSWVRCLGCGSGVWVVVGLWVRCLGRGWRRGSLWWLWFFFFLLLLLFFSGCDLCLKGLWVVVGSGVWVVDRRSFTRPLSHLSSSIGELGLVGGSVGLIGGWIGLKR